MSTLDRYRLGHSSVRTVLHESVRGAGSMFSRSPVSESELAIWRKVVLEKRTIRAIWDIMCWIRLG